MIDTTKSVLVNLLFEYALDGYDEDDDGEIANSIIVKIKAEGVKEYEQSKWVKFDEYDEATYPPFDTHVLTLVVLDDMKSMSVDLMTHNKEWYNAIRLSYVTHWQPLPIFKE